MAIDLSDRSGNSNTLTNNGAATEVTTSLPFAGSTSGVQLTAASSQYLSAIDSVPLSFSTTFTIEGWFNFDSLPTDTNQMNLVNKGDRAAVATLSYRIYVRNQGGEYRLGAIVTDGTNQDSYYVVVTPSTGTWYHYAITCNTGNASATTFEFFVGGSSAGNGTAIVADNIATINDTTEPLLIGAGDNTAVDTFFDGKIDEMRFWGTVRTSTEINNNKSNEIASGQGAAYYPFDELSSASASLSPSASQSPSASASASASKSQSPSASLSPSASISPSASASASTSASASKSLSPSASQSPSASESKSLSPSASTSASASKSASASASRSASASSSASASASSSASLSPSASASASESKSASASASASSSASLSPSSSGSRSASTSVSASASASPSPARYVPKYTSLGSRNID